MKMKKKTVFWLALLAFILLLAGAYVLYDRLSQQTGPGTLGTAAPPAATVSPSAPSASDQSSASSEDAPLPAPDFTVVDGLGNESKLSDYFGKPIVLNFWASWCGPCKSEMPDFNETHAALGDKVHFLMVNMTTSSQETLDNARKYVTDSGYSFPVFYDTKGEAATAYSVWSLPTTYFIDAEGYLVAYANSAIDRELLQTGIDMILTKD